MIVAVVKALRNPDSVRDTSRWGNNWLYRGVRVKKELISNFYLDNNNWYLDNLDIRLSSHFNSIKSNNSHDQSVLSLLNYLLHKKKDFSFLFSKDDDLDIENIVVNQIDYIKIIYQYI